MLAMHIPFTNDCGILSCVWVVDTDGVNGDTEIVSEKVECFDSYGDGW